MTLLILKADIASRYQRLLERRTGGDPAAMAAEDRALTLRAHAALEAVDHKATPAQREAGNYRKHRIRFQGLDIAIENPRGSVRRGVDRGGHEWASSMAHDYGYIRGTLGVDGDHFDVLVGPNADAPLVYVVTTMAPPDFTAVDEQKALLGFNSEEEARAAFAGMYDDPRFFGSVAEMPVAEFRDKVMTTRENPRLLKSRVLFFKAQIRGGAMGDLLAMPVTVAGHTRADGTFIAPYTALRHKAPEPIPEPDHEDLDEEVLNGLEGGPKPICPFCGEPEHVAIADMWTDGHFQLETCCQGLHDQLVQDMADDPEFAADLLRHLDVEGLGGGALRRVAYTKDGFGDVLLDWQPEVRPISRKAAMAFVDTWHRHNKALPGDLFRAGIWNGHTLLGVVIVGFPAARAYMDAFKAKELCEVRRLCVRTDLPKELTWKACSTLYQYAADEAKARGYKKIITYTLRDEESGMSLRYARWKPEGESGGGSWNTPSRPREDSAPTSPKTRWAKILVKDADKPAPPPAPKVKPGHGAPPVVSFRSGASAPADFRGYMQAGVPVGVSLAEIGPGSATWPMIAQYAKAGGQVFVDSGAFTAFTKELPPVDFHRVMDLYRQLADAAKGGRLHFVCPDVVGDQLGSFRVLAEHRESVRDLIARGHDALVPIQRGELTPYQSWQEVRGILGTDDFTVAVPSNEVAFDLDDIANLFDGPEKPKRVHLLGVAGNADKLGRLVKAIHTRAPDCVITSDANRLRAKVGEGRAVTEETARQVKMLGEDKWSGTVDGMRAFDLTELLGRVAYDANWLRPDQVRQLASSMGVTDPAAQRRWITAHRSGGLGDVLDEVDPDGRMTEHAVRGLFGSGADQAVRSAARSAAIAMDERREHAQQDLFAWGVPRLS